MVLLASLTVPGFGVVRGLISQLGLISERVLAKLGIVHTFKQRGQRRRQFSRTGHGLAGARLFAGHIVAFVVPKVVVVVCYVALLVI